jgi:phage tail sheath protein FI
VPTSTTFTITSLASFATTAITTTNLVATATFAAKTYVPFAIGSSITISGSTPAGYSGTFVVLSCTTTSLTFAVGSALAAASVQGNIVQTIPAATALNTTFTQTAASSTNALIIANFSKAPGTSTQAAAKSISNDELHALVMDSVTGHISGTASQVLEKYEFMSKLKGIVRGDGTNLFWRTVINSASKYVLALSAPADTAFSVAGDVNWGTHIDAAAASAVLDALITSFNTMTLGGGADVSTPSDANYQEAFLMFADTLNFDISLLALGAVSPATANAVIAGVAETRLDCIVFASPTDTNNAPIIATGSAGVSTINTWKSSITNSSYVVMDSGWKYQYDRYNDEYRWIPLNADIAGLCARTDYTADPWFSPGGFTRGQIKNVIKLGFNPGQTERDNLYKANVNPVVTFPGQGTILFGDKTFMAKPSAFDRINVRRLFIVLEKSISIAAKFQLFELNDEFTRAQFKNLIEPFLRNVQGRRGITDFVVKCDTSNNTGDVIDANQFVASIFIKPNRSINFITLNFVAARSSVNFNEIGG